MTELMAGLGFKHLDGDDLFAFLKNGKGNVFDVNCLLLKWFAHTSLL